MKKPGLIITLPEPCSEGWANMTPSEKGRYCASCQKNVIDFTEMTDAEIVRVFKKAGGDPPCGHFHISQLGRVLAEPQQHSFFEILTKKCAAVMLFFQSFTVPALAQAVKAQTVQNAGKKPVNDTLHDERVVKGVVLDKATNKGLPLVTVQIDGTEIITLTDHLTGAFWLVLPDTFVLQDFTISAHYNYPTDRTFDKIKISRDSLQKEVALYGYGTYVPTILVDGRPTGVKTLTRVEIEVMPRCRPEPLTPIENLADFVVSISPRPSFWQRITHPFHKKKQLD